MDLDLDAIKSHLQRLGGIPDFKAGRLYVEDAPAILALLAEVERLRALPRMTPALAAALEKLEDWDRGLLIPMLSSQCRRILYAYRAAKEAL